MFKTSPKFCQIIQQFLHYFFKILLVISVFLSNFPKFKIFYFSKLLSDFVKLFNVSLLFLQNLLVIFRVFLTNFPNFFGKFRLKFLQYFLQSFLNIIFLSSNFFNKVFFIFYLFFFSGAGKTTLLAALSHRFKGIYAFFRLKFSQNFAKITVVFPVYT